MKKMPCLFERDFTTRPPTLLQTVTPGCEWVLRGEGIPSRKYDGTACAVIGGELHKRYDAKRGKPAPTGGIPCDDPDPITGHWPHWVPVGDELASKWHLAAWKALPYPLPDGTYELCGPKVGANPEQFWTHRFMRHGGNELILLNLTWDGLREFLEMFEMEGIVWRHAAGRMAKLRRADFGIPWPVVSGAIFDGKEGS